MQFLRLLWRIVRILWRTIRITLAFIVIAFMLQRSTYPLYINWNAISAIVGSDKFDYLGWELAALATKSSQALWGEHPFMNETERSQFVRDYMADMAEVQQIEQEIAAIFADLNVPDPEVETAELRNRRDMLRNNLSKRQALTESILEGQVAAVLADEGFHTMGQVMPPVSMHFTRMPNLLVVSPRDRIERSVELAIDPMQPEDILALEERILQQQDMDALVVPLGGMALFPAMIRETSNIPWAVETFAHEWLHHYLFFYPVGLSYFIDTGPGGRESVFINETTANLFGQAVGQLVLERYYPEYATTSATQFTHVYAQAQATETTFDFGSAMNRTRITVDAMLLTVQAVQNKIETLYQAGYVTQAQMYEPIATTLIDQISAYMNMRRDIFFENGYYIRRLNLAYFAFYGGYQSQGIPGVAGADPIGPAIEAILANSPDLKTFVETMRGITTRDELLQIRDTVLTSTE